MYMYPYKKYMSTNENSSPYVLTTDASAKTLHFPVQLITSRFGNLASMGPSAGLLSQVSVEACGKEY